MKFTPIHHIIIKPTSCDRIKYQLEECIFINLNLKLFYWQFIGIVTEGMRSILKILFE